MWSLCVDLLSSSYIIFAVLFLAVILEYNNSKVSIVFSAILGYNLFNLFPKFFDSWIVIAVSYFMIGIVVSVWRYRQYLINRLSGRNNETDYLMWAYYKPSSEMSNITYWIINWPIVLFVNFTADFYELVSTFVSKYFEGIYLMVYKSVTNDLHKKLEIEKNQ